MNKGTNGRKHQAVQKNKNKKERQSKQRPEKHL